MQSLVICIGTSHLGIDCVEDMKSFGFSQEMLSNRWRIRIIGSSWLSLDSLGK